jgi:hypothetical protein
LENQRLASGNHVAFTILRRIAPHGNDDRNTAFEACAGSRASAEEGKIMLACSHCPWRKTVFEADRHPQRCPNTRKAASRSSFEVQEDHEEGQLDHEDDASDDDGVAGGSKGDARGVLPATIPGP